MAYGDDWIRYPGATVYNLGRSDLSSTALQHDIVCVHSMVGTLNGSLAWSSRDGGTYWHFGENADGVIRQCQDLRFKSAANLNGNWHVIPIETSDTNEGEWPSPWQGNVSWTQAQMDSLAKLIAWLCVRFDIPPVLIPDTLPGRRGIAYHRQGIDGNYPDGRVPGGEKWSNATGKTCPQDPRIEQLKAVVIPAVQALISPPPPPPIPEPEEEDMKDLVITATDRSPVWVRGDKAIPLVYVSSVNSLQDNGEIKVVPLTPVDYDKAVQVLGAAELIDVIPDPPA